MRLYLVCGLLHFLLILGVSVRETLWLAARKLTWLPAPFSQLAQNIERSGAIALERSIAPLTPVGSALRAYLHMAGIESGYGYFAPNIPASYKLVFELHYPNGRVEDELPGVNSAAAGFRLSGLLDEIGRSRSDALREHLVKMLARTMWREHPDAVTIRAIFGKIDIPSLAQFENGQRESSEFLYAYDFSRQ